MTAIAGDRASMSRRDVEQWLIASSEALVALGVKGVLGRSPDIGSAGPSSWISFTSRLGSGRVVRRDNGQCHASAHRHADGAVLIDRSGPLTTVVELAAVVSALSPFRPAAQPSA